MKLFFKIIGTIIIVALSLLIASQSITKIYRTPFSTSFSGPKLYNPYAAIDSANWSSGFLKANFHAHTRWDVNGSYTLSEFYDAYKFSKYDIINVSDHNYITSTIADTPFSFATSYEHGYNLNNFHTLMLSATKVDFIDVPLMFMPRHQMQYAIERLSSQAKAFSINHPERVRLLPDSLFANLRGFSLMEINPDADARFWDQILSQGNFTALVASDDSHSITNRNSWFQRAFTMVCANTQNPTHDHIIDALKKGQAYAVVVSNERNAQGSHVNFPAITNVSTNDTTITVQLSENARKITFIGQNGKHIKAFSNLQQASIEVPTAEPYIRIEVEMNDGIKFLTNPIVRTVDGEMPYPLPMPESILWLTILNIVGWNFLALLFLFNMLRAVWRKKSKRTNFEDVMWGAGLKPYDPH